VIEEHHDALLQSLEKSNACNSLEPWRKTAKRYYGQTMNKNGKIIPM